MLNEKLYTVSDVAKLTGMTDRTIRKYLKDGVLKGRKIGVQWRFTEADIQQLFRDYVPTPAFTELDNNAVIDLLEHQAEGTVTITKLDGFTYEQIQNFHYRLRQEAAAVQILCQYEETRQAARFIFSGPSQEICRLIELLDANTNTTQGNE